MHISVKVKNLGTIKEANINIGDLTIFAGTNTTGKSYVSRTLYSIFSALRDDPYKAYYTSTLIDFGDRLFILSRNSNYRLRKALSNKRRNSDISSKVDQAIEDFLTDNVSGIIEKISRESQENFYYKDSGNLQKADEWENIKKLIEPVLKKEKLLHDSIAPILEEAQGQTANISGISKEYKEIISVAFKQFEKDLNVTQEVSMEEGFSYLVLNNLKDNFQVSALRDLIGAAAKPKTTIQLKYADGEFTLGFSEQEINTKPHIKKPLVFPKIIYLESPVYWKLRRPLSRMLYSHRERGRHLNGVPGFFYDAVWELLNPIDKDMDNSSLLAELTESIEKIIGGEITLNPDTEELRFIERSASSTKEESHGNGGRNGRGLGLLLTATGTVQLGMIGLFIKKGAIDKGTILFIDEPEAHLHTDWQQKFMGIIYELVKYGVHVVMATHSPVMMQKLELLQMSEEGPKPDVALNFFPKNEKYKLKDETYDEINKKIAKSLEDPIYEMYLRKLLVKKHRKKNEK